MFAKTLLVASICCVALVGSPATTPTARAHDVSSVEEIAARVSTVDALRRRLDARLEALGTARRVRFVAAVTGLSERASATVVELISAAGPRSAAALERATDASGRAGGLTARIAELSARRGRLETELARRDAQIAAALSTGDRSRFPADVERWRPLVRRYFPHGRIEEALAVMRCESGGDPQAKNRRSSARGLFQFLSGTWRMVTTARGVGGADPYDPEANIASAAWLVRTSVAAGLDPWAHWSCRP